jgi:arsenite transporter
VTRDAIERHQVWLYLAAIAAGLVVGGAAPASAPVLEALLWPALALLLYVTFTQVPLNHLSDAFRDRRFLAAALIGNFLLIPLLVLALLPLLPGDAAIKLGVLLVLLVPCTDWFIAFVHLARGETKRAIAITPLNWLLQLLLLPVYLWLFVGDSFVQILSTDRLLTAFGVLIAFPSLPPISPNFGPSGMARAKALPPVSAGFQFCCLA